MLGVDLDLPSTLGASRGPIATPPFRDRGPVVAEPPFRERNSSAPGTSGRFGVVKTPHPFPVFKENRRKKEEERAAWEKEEKEKEKKEEEDRKERERKDKEKKRERAKRFDVSSASTSAGTQVEPMEEEVDNVCLVVARQDGRTSSDLRSEHYCPSREITERREGEGSKITLSKS